MTGTPSATVNGVAVPVPSDGRRLVHWLREDLGLTGTKHPCGAGHCGGCSVLVDGHPALACTTMAATLGDTEITTIEGLAARGDALLRCFVEKGAVQCGMCTPGMVVAARAFLNATYGARRTTATVREALAGNVCRCTGYTQIVRAVLAAGADDHAENPCEN
ncbi:(2Fe-2S)-binding protein [Actinomadura rugatobispora]|uniref:(2Fe-2S)-binding protein n=1 Tax=Actinomadura rugatobispora TaxID=1994 RepID=A0ABW1A6E1_9ACTN|nr:hypothetical protein GCM10010200_042880 [Actinomadura rugatobispora]